MELLQNSSSTSIDKKITVRLEENEKDGATEDDTSTIQTARIMRALGNPDVMEHLARFLDIKELGSWYDTCQTVKDNIDELQIWRKRAELWRKHAVLLADIFRPTADEEFLKNINRTFDCKIEESVHFRELYKSLEVHVDRLREKMNLIRKERGRLYLSEITNAARLAHHGLLGSVEHLTLRNEEGEFGNPWGNLDLASIETEHLASLVSCVTERIDIPSVIINCDIRSLLDNVKSNGLFIDRHSLSSEETQALVRAMESDVKCVMLGREASLDISALTQYSGQGKCKSVYGFKNITMDRHREELKSWAVRINWGTHEDNDLFVKIIS